MNKSPRLVALEVLNKIFINNSFSNITLDNALKDTEGDKAFISALVYGVCERRITLDYLINKHLTSKPKPKIYNILRLGAYQLIYMDKVPSSAAVNESVKLTHDIKQDYYSKLVNAVLHKIDNDREIPDDLSVLYSVPENLLNMWIKQYTREKVLSFLPSLLGRPPVFAVPNTLYLDNDELSYELISEGIDCEVQGDLVRINSGLELDKVKSFSNGLFHIEDSSSYDCAVSLGAKEGETVLDVCSAPGGKAFTIAERMNNKGKLYSFDLYKNRLNLINIGAKRLGIEIIETSIQDAGIYNSEIPLADRILCDVPCSGFGIIRRKPEIKYKELDSIKDLPNLQLEILSNSSRYLKNGGVLVYSTCTLNKKENEKVVNAFLENNKGFSLDYMKTVFPSIEGGDGFFHAKLIKNK